MSHELTAYLSVFKLFLTQRIMTILSKRCKSDFFEFFELSFKNIQDPQSYFVECESFLESTSLDIIALCETNLDDSINSRNFCVIGYLPLI